MVEPIVNDPTQEFGYAIQRTGLFAAGKQAAEVAGSYLGGLTQELLGMPAREAANNAALLGGAFASIGGFLVIGLSAAVSAGLTQMDYLHRKDNLAKLYKDELSAKLGKPVDKVRTSDLEELAKQNHTIHEELSRSRKQRNYGLGLSFIASMAALAMMKIGVPFIAATVFSIPVLPAIGLTLGGMATVAVSMTVAVVTYSAVKAPLHALADKLFGIDEVTTNDHIVAIQRAHNIGKTIIREQVLSVFISAHPELSQHIIAEYGQHFDSLKADMRQKVAAEINTYVPLDRLTLDINSNKINATELAFAVEGEASGVAQRHPKPEKKKGMLGEFFSGMVKVNLTSAKASAHAHVSSGEVDASSIMAITQAAHSEVGVTGQSPEKSFVTSLGLAPREQGLTHLQQAEQASTDPAAGQGLST